MSGPADYLALGDWNVVCFECGRKYKASQLKRQWQGYFVCESCYTPRQPQDFVRGIKDEETPAWVQPDPEPVFVGACSPNTITAYPGVAGPGCCMPGYISPAYDPTIIYED